MTTWTLGGKWFRLLDLAKLVTRDNFTESGTGTDYLARLKLMAEKGET